MRKERRKGNERERVIIRSRIQWVEIVSIIIALGIILQSPLISSVSAETMVCVNDISAHLNEIVNISINIYNAKDIGSMDISLRYDPNVLLLKEVEKGDLMQGSVIQWNVEGDKVLIGLIDGNGINGNGSLVILTFDVGCPGSSVLDIEAAAYNVFDFSSIRLTTKDGVFTVKNGTKPTATPPQSGSSASGRVTATGKRGELEPMIISIGDIYAYPNSIKVPINVQNASDVGSVDFYLHFNSSVLNLIDISKSELTANSLLQWSVNESKIKILIIDATGINGDGTLVYLTFNVVGTPRSITYLNISELEISNAFSMEEIPAIINNGTLFVISEVGNETMSEDNKTIKDAEIPTRNTSTPQSTQKPYEKIPGFEATISELALALLAMLLLEGNRRKKK